MDDALKRQVLALLAHHRIMTVATNRPDGWPQATTVGYVNDGLILYFLCSPESQKAKNLTRDDRISSDHRSRYDQPDGDYRLIDGCPCGTSHRSGGNGGGTGLLDERYPEYAGFAIRPEEIRVYRVVPKVISVLDYTKGFGHSELVVL